VHALTFFFTLASVRLFTKRNSKHLNISTRTPVSASVAEAAAQEEAQPELRLDDEPECGGVPVVRRQRKREAREDERHEHLDLDEREVLAEAGARAEAEGHERLRVLARGRHAVAEPAGVEASSGGAPDGGVVVHGGDGDEEVGALGRAEPAELHVAEHLTHHERRRREEAQRLQDHRVQRLHPGDRVEVRRRRGAADAERLGARAVLPLRVRGEEHEAPRRGDRARLVAREVDVLAVVHDEVVRARLVPAAVDDGAQEVAAGRQRRRCRLALARQLQDQRPDLVRELPDPPVLPRGQVPERRDGEDDAGLGHEARQRPEPEEDLPPPGVVAPEAGPGDDVEGEAPDVLVHVELRDAARRGGDLVLPRRQQRLRRVHHQLHHALRGARTQRIKQVNTYGRRSIGIG
jgi:hypothetical protein